MENASMLQRAFFIMINTVMRPMQVTYNNFLTFQCHFHVLRIGR